MYYEWLPYKYTMHFAVSMEVCNRNKLLYYCTFNLYVTGLVPSYGILSLPESREQ